MQSPGLVEIVNQMFDTLASQEWRVSQRPEQVEPACAAWLRRQLFLGPQDSVHLGGIVARIYQILSNMQQSSNSDSGSRLINKVIVRLISFCEAEADCLISKRCLEILRHMQSETNNPEPGPVFRSAPVPVLDPSSKPVLTLGNVQEMLALAVSEKRFDVIASCFGFLREIFLTNADLSEQSASTFLYQYLSSLGSSGVSMAVLCARAACLIKREAYRDTCLHFLHDRNATPVLRVEGPFVLKIIDSDMQVHQAGVYPEIICTLNDYFRGMIGGEFNEKQSKSVVFIEQNAKLFLEMLDFIHEGRIELRLDNVYEFTRLADQYLVPRLKYQCEKVLEKEYDRTLAGSNLETLDQELSFADFHHAEGLRNNLLHRLIRRMLQEGKWHSSSHEECPQMALLSEYRYQMDRLDLSAFFAEKSLKGKYEAKSLACLIACLPNLTALNLSYCDKLNDALAETILKNLGKLQRLNLSDCPNIGQNTIRSLIKYQHTTLTELNLAGCSAIDYFCIDLLAQGMASLTSLNLRRCHKFKNHVLSRLAQSPLRLRSLAVGGFQCDVWDYGLGALTLNQTALQELDISWCSETTTWGVSEIASRLTQLVSLNLTDCNKIHDNAVIQVATRLRNLRTLHLSMCGELTDVSLAAIEVHLPRLEVLGLARCSRFKETGLVSMLYHLNELRCLNLMNNLAVTDQVLRVVAGHCPMLETLNVGYSCISDDSVMVLLKSLKRLRHLDLQNCSYISDEVIEFMMREGIFLESVNLTGCSKLTRETVNRLREFCDKVIYGVR